MFQLLETIKCKDGKLFHLSFHNSRLNNAREEQFGITKKIDLNDFIKIPENCKTGLFRCRIIYSKEIIKIEFLPHKYRKIRTVKLIENNTIDYHLKYENRDLLQQLFEKREDCDEIIIIKDGCITDSFTANVVLFDGEKWWTPNTPLLNGTQRTRLLKESQIFECRITPNDLSKYRRVKFINALQDLNESPEVDIKNISF